MFFWKGSLFTDVLQCPAPLNLSYCLMTAWSPLTLTCSIAPTLPHFTTVTEGNHLCLQFPVAPGCIQCKGTRPSTSHTTSKYRSAERHLCKSLGARLISKFNGTVTFLFPKSALYVSRLNSRANIVHVEEPNHCPWHSSNGAAGNSTTRPNT